MEATFFALKRGLTKYFFISALELGLNEIFWGLNGMFHQVRKVGFTLGYLGIRMDVRIPPISRIRTDFLEPQCFVSSKK
jgi:hypothetical protein